jgi:hypothetical protein
MRDMIRIRTTIADMMFVDVFTVRLLYRPIEIIFFAHTALDARDV